jgi:hypothetical protein
MNRRKFLQTLGMLGVAAVAPITLIAPAKSYGLFGIDPELYNQWKLGHYQINQMPPRMRVVSVDKENKIITFAPIEIG